MQTSREWFAEGQAEQRTQTNNKGEKIMNMMGKMKTIGMRIGVAMLAGSALSGIAGAANLLTESFTHTNAPGWSVGGSAFLTVPSLDSNGSGWLRLTPNANNQAGYAIYNTGVAASNGIQVAFDFNDWGGRRTSCRRPSPSHH